MTEDSSIGQIKDQMIETLKGMPQEITPEAIQEEDILLKIQKTTDHNRTLGINLEVILEAGHHHGIDSSPEDINPEVSPEKDIKRVDILETQTVRIDIYIMDTLRNMTTQEDLEVEIDFPPEVIQAIDPGNHPRDIDILEIHHKLDTPQRTPTELDSHTEKTGNIKTMADFLLGKTMILTLSRQEIFLEIEATAVREVTTAIEGEATATTVREATTATTETTPGPLHPVLTLFLFSSNKTPEKLTKINIIVLDVEIPLIFLINVLNIQDSNK